MIRLADTCVALKYNQRFFIYYILLKEETFSEGKTNSKTNLYLTLELAHLKQSEFTEKQDTVFQIRSCHLYKEVILRQQSVQLFLSWMALNSYNIKLNIGWLPLIPENGIFNQIKLILRIATFKFPIVNNYVPWRQMLAKLVVANYSHNITSYKSYILKSQLIPYLSPCFLSTMILDNIYPYETQFGKYKSFFLLLERNGIQI